MEIQSNDSGNTLHFVNVTKKATYGGREGGIEGNSVICFQP